MSGGGKRSVFLIAGILGAIIVAAKIALFLLDILQPYRLPASDWRIYQENFITSDGRVIDTGNENVSHSEGQGYGMLIALAYKDREAFDRIWGWTQKNLQTRPDDKLLSWLWKPGDGGGAVADPNNASDGDLLVAWALVRADREWKDYRYQQAAAQILIDLARLAIKDGPDGPYLLPGIHGFVEDIPANPPAEEIAEKPPVVENTPPPVDALPVAETPAPAVVAEQPGASPSPAGTPTPDAVVANEPADAPLAEAKPLEPVESSTPAPEKKVAAVTLNASYYIFPALREIAAAFPGTRWEEVGKAGEVLVQKGSFGKWHLPPDWTTVTADGQFQISSKFPPLFGYNAVRVPLHLAWQNQNSPLLAPFAEYWKQFGANTIPATVNLSDDTFGKDPALPGMRAIATLTMHCVDKRNLTVRAIPVLTKGEPYFSASLTLLTKIAVRETFAEK